MTFARTITAHLPEGDVTESFPIPDGAREMLLEGLDEIGLTLRHADKIRAYEARRQAELPWLFR